MSSLHAALADRYAIERELGRGASATVYLARDVKHDRRVAIKVLRPELAASLGSERFLREIHTAARLQHPHILPLYDSGEANGLLFYAMPYMEGESLRSRLVRDQQLPLEEALRITQEVADALTYAHAHNVVHRDIKPENILLSGDRNVADGERHALVADFGIARAISAAGGDTLTQAGIAVGTPSYMSPEQASAEEAVDGRADTYALGCVLYEMLAGHPPFLGSSAREILARHVSDPVPPLRASRPDLPASIDEAVGRALSKTPADRYETTAAFSVALASRSSASTTRRRRKRWLLYGAAAAAILIVGYGVLKSIPAITGAPGAAADSTQSIAVLPFTNVGGDPTNEPFSDGIADELTTALGKIPGLIVTARTSAFSLKRKGLEPRDIGRQLRVQYILEGSVRRAANRRRVTADLIDVASGKEVWSDGFEHDALSLDVFTMQDSMTRSIVRQILPRFSRSALASAGKHATESPEAYYSYQQGRFFFERRDSASLATAQRHYQDAISKDTTYALAYAALSLAYSQQSGFGYAFPKTNFAKAKVAGARALALDTTLAEVYNSLAFISLFYDWDLPKAGAEFQRALSINPRYAAAHLFRAWYFTAIDSTPAAVAEGRLAVELEPLSSVNNLRMVSWLFYGRRYEEALDWALRILERDPNFPSVKSELARVYAYLGRCDSALAVLRGAPAEPSAIFGGVAGYIFAKCGRRPQAFAELDRLRSQAKAGKYTPHYSRAVIQSGLGNKDEAIAELEKAFVQKDWPMYMLMKDPAFDGLRSDPRFVALVRKVGLTT